MPTYSIKSEQRIPVALAEAWTFFSDPANLPVITPRELNFQIISKHHGEKMYAGQLIEYKVTPLFFPVYWMTEITQVKHLEYFIDEQRFGPYSLWHHQHHFKSVDSGVVMTDIVHYRIPMGFLGRMAHALVVKKKIDMIFEFRRKKILEIFPG